MSNHKLAYEREQPAALFETEAMVYDALRHEVEDLSMRSTFDNADDKAARMEHAKYMEMLSATLANLRAARRP